MPAAEANVGSMSDDWQFWNEPAQAKDSILFRYGFAGLLALVAALLTIQTVEFEKDPLIFFFGALVVSSIIGGLGPGIFATLLGIAFVGCFFTPTLEYLPAEEKIREIAHLLFFTAVAFIGCSFTAGCRRAKENLRQNEECYRMLAQTAADGIITVDHQGAMLFFNSGSERIFGCGFKNCLGQSLFELIPDPTCRAKLGEMHRDWNSREYCPIPLKGRDQTGRELDLEVTFGPFNRPGKTGFTLFIRKLVTQTGTEITPKPRFLLVNSHAA